MNEKDKNKIVNKIFPTHLTITTKSHISSYILIPISIHTLALNHTQTSVISQKKIPSPSSKDAKIFSLAHAVRHHHIAQKILPSIYSSKFPQRMAHPDFQDGHEYLSYFEGT